MVQLVCQVKKLQNRKITVTMNRRYIQYILLIIVFTMLFSGCTVQKKSSLPPGNVVELNSPKNEFAPVFFPSTTDSLLYVTTSQKGSEVLKKFSKNQNKYQQVENANSSFVPSIYDYIHSNDGTIAFFNNAPNEPITTKKGFIASTFDLYSRFPNQNKSKFGKNEYHVGGTDLYQFIEEEGTLVIANHGAPLNSEFWDSHPTVAHSGDTMFVVFASDRPSNGNGFSSPFAKTFERDSMIVNTKGNSDLYYAFGVNGVWTVRNFSEVLGIQTVNSDSNEYSPFLYCVQNKFCSNAQPATLLFSSKVKGDYQIYDADIVIDYSKQQVIVDNVNQLESPINSTADDYFPTVPLPHTNNSNEIFFSSNRFSARGGPLENVGGYDIYKFPYSKPCRAPQIQYSIVFVDQVNPLEEPLGPFEVTLKNANGEVIQTNTTNPSVFTIECGTKYSVFAKSLHDKIECKPESRTISHYASQRIVDGTPIITSREIVTTIDSIVGGRTIVTFDSTFRTKKYSINELKSYESNNDANVMSIRVENDSIVVKLVEVTKKSTTVGGKVQKISRKIAQTDTIQTKDTILVPLYKEAIPSKLSMAKGYFELFPAHDTTIIDTVFLLPQYYNFPPCKWEFSRNIIDEFRRNVPYFQTGFWEVNTLDNFNSHKKLLATKEFDGASFIELHNENKYFGVKGVPPEYKRGRAAKRERRWKEYQDFAKAIDQNLQEMVTELGDNIIPLYLDIKERTPGGSKEKLIIQIQAYSDRRPIEKGTYIGETIQFTEGEYNSVDKSFSINPIQIQNGASLVGESNEVLSQLRVYNGYKEVITRLIASKKYPYLNKLHSDGKLLLPDDVPSKAEFEKRLEKAEIVIVAKGKYYDENVVSKVKGYVGKDGDFKSYDDVRRVDVRVDRIEIVGGKIIKTNCCVETPLPLIDPEKPQFSPIR